MSSTPASLWDPQRVEFIGSILSRYSAYIAPGHRIRLGIEGDPCGVYRGTEAPSATVLTVDREADGGDVVRLTAQIDETSRIVDLDNSSLNPKSTWEVHPKFLEEFRGIVEAAQGGAEETAPETSWHNEAESWSPEPAAPPEAAPDDTHYRQVRDDLESMQARMTALEKRDAEFRDTMTAAVRELSGDLMRTARGDSLEFAYRYADRYDLALQKQHDEAPDYRRSGNGDVYQNEKLDFDTEDNDVPRVEYQGSGGGNGGERHYGGDIREMNTDITDGDE